MDMRRIKDERTGIADLMWQELRKWCPEIVPVAEHECTDGQWRSIWGKPVGVEFTGKSRFAGYAYRDSTGVTIGKRGKTEDELKQRWSEGQERARADFMEHVMAETEDEWFSRRQSFEDRQKKKGGQR